jgi:transcriptional regulator with XRE-family HTH domain
MSIPIPGTECQLRPTRNFRVATGRHLRSIRAAYGDNQRDFAGRLGISSEALSKIETGRASPTVRGLWQMACRMGVPVDSLLPELPFEDSRATDRLLYRTFRQIWARPLPTRELLARFLDLLLQFPELAERTPQRPSLGRAYAPRP